MSTFFAMVQKWYRKKHQPVLTISLVFPVAEIKTQGYAKPIFDDLEVWLRGQASRQDAAGQGDPICADPSPIARPYLDHGVLEPDNSTAERAVRPVTLGRKNYLFMGSEAGGKSAAIAYNLIGTCKLNA